MNDDPCLQCTLPDCDETSKGCLVRRRSRQYDLKLRNGQHGDITDDERHASTLLFKSWHLERMALASEGVRPYKRPGSPWTGQDGAR
ncbi:hypothetical protein [Aliihoeflea sp. PC F10.4]